jgi:hypothetical protein
MNIADPAQAVKASNCDLQAAGELSHCLAHSPAMVMGHLRASDFAQTDLQSAPPPPLLLLEDEPQPSGDTKRNPKAVSAQLSEMVRIVRFSSVVRRRLVTSSG